MKKSIIKKIAINMAFFQIFSSQIMHFSKNVNQFDYSLQTNITSSLKPKSGDDCQLVKKVNNDEIVSKTKQTVSIFDYENIKSKQYGASQIVFKSHFEQLINDPLIWEEMQAYFSVNKFDCLDDAMFFYQKYFYIIYDCGCGYAAATNYVFQMFEGREDEFYHKFGFPMYTFNDNGVIDFNYELFMLKFFNYSIIKKYKQEKLIYKAIAKEFYKYKINYYRNAKRSTNLSVRDIAKWTDDDWAKHRDEEQNNEKKLKEYMEKYANIEDEEYNFGIALEAKFGYLNSFLSKYGINIKSNIKNGLGKPSINDIVASDSFKLYNVDNNKNATYSKEVEPHYVYITEITDDGTIIVSSWGDIYIFDDEQAKWMKKIVLNMSK